MAKQSFMQKRASQCDAFSPQPTLYYRGTSRISTVKGCLTTLLIAAVLILVTVTDILDYASPNTQVVQYNTIHKYIDLVDFNPFVDDNMQLAFTIKNEINSDATVDYKDTQIYPSLIYAQSSENTDLPQFTIIPLVKCNSADFEDIDDISIFGRVRPNPERSDTALYKDLYCPDWVSALDNNPLLTKAEVGKLTSQYTRVYSNYLALVIRNNNGMFAMDTEALKPLRAILYASTTDVDQQEIEEGSSDF